MTWLLYMIVNVMALHTIFCEITLNSPYLMRLRVGESLNGSKMS